MQVVSQVSLPVRIALVACLAFAALWFVALRPKPVATEPAPAGAQSAPGQAAEQAQQAAGAQAQGVEKTEAAANDPAAAQAPAAAAVEPGTKQAAKPGTPIDVQKAADDEVAKPAAAVLRDIEKGKVAVLLFWDRKVSDDRAVHRAVTDLSRRKGKVAVHTAPMSRIARFEQITRGVPVVTSPTVLIIDRARRARWVSGLTVTTELEDLVDKAIRVRP